MDRNHRRKFGQNFLNNPGIIQAILRDIPWESGHSILEVGPGHGALTKGFLAGGAKVTSVEIDEVAAGVLKESIPSPDFRLVLSDFMDFDLEEYVQNNDKSWLVGNLPYNMATPIIAKILPHLHHFHGLMIMVQYEAAQRLVAETRTKEYGFLTVQRACFASAKLLRKVKPENFTPKPNVMSATLLLQALPQEERLNPEMLDTVGTGFRQRRKKLMNNWKALFPTEKILEAYETFGHNPNVRAEELNAKEFHDLYQFLSDSNPD